MASGDKIVFQILNAPLTPAHRDDESSDNQSSRLTWLLQPPGKINGKNVLHCFAYSALAIPGAVLGANTLWHLPPQMSDICIGSFFLLLVPLMAWSRKHNLRLNIGLLAACGLIVGFLTGMVFSTGPMTVPLFAGFGLMKQGLIATESAASLIVFVTKTSTFAAIGALPPSVVFSGIFVGASQIAGIFLSKGLVARMPTRLFHLLVAGMMIVAGISMVWNGINSLS